MEEYFQSVDKSGLISAAVRIVLNGMVLPTLSCFVHVFGTTSVLGISLSFVTGFLYPRTQLS